MDDLISRKALLEDISESVVFSVRSGETSAELRGAHKITDRINAAPAVDAVEVVRCAKCKHYDERFNPNTNNYCYEDGKRDAVKHGRWIKSGIMEPGYECSECGQAYAWWNCSEAHYCPNCGARMAASGI